MNSNYSNQLELSNYFIVDSTDSKPREDITGNDLRCRGIVFKKVDDEYKLVASTFPYTEEFSVANIDAVDSLVKEGEWYFYPSYEGSIIRIIHDEQDGTIKRIVSTHKKLDAFESYWGSNKSYGELFKDEVYRMFTAKEETSKLSRDDVFNLFLDSLDTNRHYTFLMCSNEENKVVSSLDNKILFVGSFDRESNTYQPHTSGIESCVINFEVPVKIEIESSQDILDYMGKVDYRHQQGIIAIRRDKFDLFKIIDDTYKMKSMLRGNNSNLIYRYFQLVSLKETDMLLDFVDLFKNSQPAFLQAERDIMEMCIYLHQTYFMRYIQKKFVFVSPIYHSVLKSIHNWHLQDKRNNITTMEVVASKVRQCDCKTFFNMWKEFVSMKQQEQPII